MHSDGMAFKGNVTFIYSFTADWRTITTVVTLFNPFTTVRCGKLWQCLSCLQTKSQFRCFTPQWRRWILQLSFTTRSSHQPAIIIHFLAAPFVDTFVAKLPHSLPHHPTVQINEILAKLSLGGSLLSFWTYASSSKPLWTWVYREATWKTYPWSEFISWSVVDRNRCKTSCLLLSPRGYEDHTSIKLNNKTSPAYKKSIA